MSKGWYISLTEGDPIDDNSDIYNIHLACLDKPILQWFNELFEIPPGSGNENTITRNKFVNKTLSYEENFISEFGLWTSVVNSITTISHPSVVSTSTLFQFIKEYFRHGGGTEADSVEIRNFSIVVIPWIDNFYHFAFFTANALDEEGAEGVGFFTPFVERIGDSDDVLLIRKTISVNCNGEVEFGPIIGKIGSKRTVE